MAKRNIMNASLVCGLTITLVVFSFGCLTSNETDSETSGGGASDSGTLTKSKVAAYFIQTNPILVDFKAALLKSGEYVESYRNGIITQGN